MGEIVGIARDTLLTCLASAEDYHPSKFVAHLRSEDAASVGVEGSGEVLTEVVFVPESGSRRGDVFRLLGVDTLPRSSSVVGTVSSAPTGELESEDYTRFTNRGRVHIVAFPPYDEESWRVYTSDGKERGLSVVDAEFDDDDGGWLDVLSRVRR